jgi:hypothetical protein
MPTSADLQFLPDDLYAIRNMGKFFRKQRWGMARRWVAIAALVSFMMGNIGWPQSAEKSSERGCCGKLVKLTAGGGCCCGKQKQKASCGCGKALVEAKASSCCQKKKAAPEKPVVAVSACRCGDESFPGFIVVSQPKLGANAVEMPRLVEAFAVPLIETLGAPQGALPPETPPPRTSAA